jgi:hypothetical protein
LQTGFGKSRTKQLQCAETPKVNAPTSEIQLLTNLPEMKVGEKTKIAVMVKSATAFVRRFSVCGSTIKKSRFARSASATCSARARNSGDAVFESKRQDVRLAFVGERFGAKRFGRSRFHRSRSAQRTANTKSLSIKTFLNMLTADGKNFAVKF